MKKYLLILIMLFIISLAGCSLLSNTTTTLHNTTKSNETTTTSTEDDKTTSDVTSEDIVTTIIETESMEEVTTDHTHIYDDGVVIKEATCREEGIKTYTCTICGETKREKIEKLNHIYDDGVITKESSCAIKGEKTYTCTICGNTYKEELALIDHTVVVDEAVAPTCSATGLTEGSHCEVCGLVITKQEVINKLDHTYVVESRVDATCTTSGEVTYKCSVCSDTYKETISPTGHDYQNSGDYTEPTCFTSGKGSKTCINCGDTIAVSLDNAHHNYENGYCTGCGIPYIKYLVDTFGNDVDLYTNNETNPYGIDLNRYGSNVLVMFYTPNLSTDPYENTTYNKNNFYTSTYKIATTYEEAYFRTQHKLISGDISDSGLNYLPNKSDAIKTNNKYTRISQAVYVLSPDGDYLAYIPNSNTMDRAIFYGGGYVSMNDVAAYLLAFGEVPPNSSYSSSNKSQAVTDYGKYGRCNNTQFSGDITRYPYEPELPYILSSSTIFNGKRIYYETDFGALGGFESESGSVTSNYNTGSTINRNVCRFVFVHDDNVTSIDDRYVFYTYNHYNDFEEYLNHDNAWGLRFGNCSGGGTYNSKTNCNPTPYPFTNYLNEYKDFTKSKYHKGDSGSIDTPVDPINPGEVKTVTLSYTGTSSTNLSEGLNDAGIVNLDSSIFSIYANKNGNASNVGLNKNGTIRLYASSGNGNTLVVEIDDKYVINSIKINFSSTISDTTINDGASFSPVPNGSSTITINSSSVTIKNVGTQQLHIVSIEITYTEK